ncbi:MAG: HEPN domain-containing protein [Defluviitaleaceae bacterium]|nr:HEPN domain-containing protein [Defluviitaleaceae bacterium]
MDKKALSQARLEQARDCLIAAQMLLNSNLYKDSANRSYYAIFHAMRAVLALDGFDSKKHSGIMSQFNIRHIRTGNFEKRFSKIIESTFTVRNHSDYDDMYIAIKSDIAEQLANAEEFVAAVAAYLASQA